MEGTHGRIGKLEDKTTEITQPEQQKKNRLKKNEQSLRACETIIVQKGQG